MRTTKTKTPMTSNTCPITVSVKDSFADEEFEAKGTVTVHKYTDGMRLVFAKIKTPFGLGTLKLSFHPISGWSRDAIQMPTHWLHVNWSSVTNTLASMCAA